MKKLDLISGNILSKLILFATPLFLGNVFQQLYNVADSIILGNFVGTNALAAVNSTGALIFMLVGFFQGTFVCAGVVISKHFGADNREKVNQAISTIILFGLVCSVILTLIGYFITPVILVWMKTPLEVYDDTNSYLQIYFLGSAAIVMYNILTGIHNAVGDSRNPLIYLIIASIVNVLLDLLFVGVFGWGVRGAAYATIISQFISALLAFIHLLTIKDYFRLNLKKMVWDKELLKDMMRMGIPAGVQNSVISIANIVVQSSINIFGPVAMAGNGSFVKLEGFMFIPVTTFSMALTTFIGQNLGAMQYDRARKGAKYGILVCNGIACTLGILLFFFSRQMLRIFDSNPAVLDMGQVRSNITSLFFILCSTTHCCAGILRGAGKSKIPMYVMLGSWCIIRIAYIKVALHFIPTIETVFWAYPITWTISATTLIIYLLKSDWIHGLEKKEERRS